MKQQDAMRFLHMGCGESLQASRVAQVSTRPASAAGPQNGRRTVKNRKRGKSHEGQR